MRPRRRPSSRGPDFGHAAILLIAAFTIALTATAARADPIDDSAFDVQTRCGFCHSIDGNSVMARFPRLAGQDEAYLLKELRDYKAERRRNDGNSMVTNVEAVSDADLAAAARYFAALPVPVGASSRSDASAGELTLGARLYRWGRPAGAASGKVPACRTCHAGDAFLYAAVPHLGGQHAGYIEKQLEDFRAGRRANDPKGVMRGIAGRLSPKEITAVAAFLSSVRDPDMPPAALDGAVAHE